MDSGLRYLDDNYGLKDVTHGLFIPCTGTGSGTTPVSLRALLQSRNESNELYRERHYFINAIRHSWIKSVICNMDIEESTINFFSAMEPSLKNNAIKDYPFRYSRVLSGIIAETELLVGLPQIVLNRMHFHDARSA